MKIELTKSEALTILAQHFNTPVEDVAITSPKADLIDQEMAKYRYTNRYTSDQKIMAIKALRKLSSDQKWSGNIMWLTDAKWAVENYLRFIAFVRKHDRLPSDGYSQLQ